MVYRVSFIFHLNAFLVPVCTRGLAHLFCWPRGRGIGPVCTRRFSFHEFYNFLRFNFLIFKTIFHPQHLPTPTLTTHDIYPLPTTFSYTSGSVVKCRLFLRLMYRSNRSFNMPPPGNTPDNTPDKCPTLGSIQVIKCPHPGDISQAQKWQKDGGNAFSCRTKSL